MVGKAGKHKVANREATIYVGSHCVCSHLDVKQTGEKRNLLCLTRVLLETEAQNNPDSARSNPWRIEQSYWLVLVWEQSLLCSKIGEEVRLTTVRT